MPAMTRDEEAKTKHCSPNIAGMARSYGGQPPPGMIQFSTSTIKP